MFVILVVLFRRPLRGLGEVAPGLLDLGRTLLNALSLADGLTLFDTLRLRRRPALRL